MFLILSRSFAALSIAIKKFSTMLRTRLAIALKSGSRAIRPLSVVPTFRSTSLLFMRHNSTSQIVAESIKQEVPLNTEQAPKRRRNLNPKLRAVRNQVTDTVNSSEDLGECVEIFDEGITYVRDIQTAESIDDFTIYTTFSRIAMDLLEKLIKADEKDLSEKFLNILIENGIVHSFNFFQVMKYNLESGNPVDNLSIWVKFLECRSTTSILKNMNTPFQFIREDHPSFNFFTCRDIVFMSYYLGAKAGHYEFLVPDLTSLLRLERLVGVRTVEENLFNNGIKLPDEFKGLRKEVGSKIFENVHETYNSPHFWNRLDNLVNGGRLRQLETLFKEARNSKEPLLPQTIYHFLASFYTLGKFQVVFDYFGELVRQGKPIGHNLWPLVIRSMGHAESIPKMSDEQRAKTSVNIQKLINTAIGQGRSMDGQLIAAAVASFANLGDYEAADSLLNTYKDVPIIFSTYDNYIHGLMLNGEITKAEKRLQSTLKTVPGYVPLTAIMNSFLNYYGKQNNVNSMNNIISFMNKHNIPEDIATVTTVTNMYFKESARRGETPKLLDILNLFKNSHIQLNSHFYGVLIDGLLRARNLPAARIVFETLEEAPTNFTMMSMMKAELQFGDIEAAETLFEKYLTSVTNDTRAWNLMISNILGKNEMLALKYYQRLKQEKINGVEPNFFTYYFLLTHFQRRNIPEVIKTILNDLETQNLEDLGKQLPKVLKEIGETIQLPENLRNKIYL